MTMGSIMYHIVYNLEDAYLRALEWSAKDIAKVPAHKLYSVRLEYFAPEYSTCPESETSLWCCVPSRKNT